jgi:hypothetical protein
MDKSQAPTSYVLPPVRATIVWRGIRRTSRNGPVSDLPPEIPNVTIRDCSVAVRLFSLRRGGRPAPLLRGGQLRGASPASWSGRPTIGSRSCASWSGRLTIGSREAGWQNKGAALREMQVVGRASVLQTQVAHTPSSEYHHGDASPAISLTDSSILLLLGRRHAPRARASASVPSPRVPPQTTRARTRSSGADRSSPLQRCNSCES